jgi:hypothetical protein
MNRDYGERWEVGFSTTGKMQDISNTARLRSGTYKRGHGANQIHNGVEPIRADDFLVTDLLADGEVPQSKKLNVGVDLVVALAFPAVSKAPFQGAS